MPNPIVVTVGPLVAANTGLYVANVTPVAGAVAVTGTAPAVPRRVSVLYGSEGSARTLQIVGTNSDGNVIAQTLAIPAGAGGSVATTMDFATVTGINAFATWSAAISVGTNGIASSKWFTNDIMRNPINIAFGATVTGTVNYTLEHTYDDPNVSLTAIGTPNQAQLVNPSVSIEPASNIPPLAWADANMVAKTAAYETTNTAPFFAWRMTINSGTGTVTVQAIQAGYVGS